LCIGGAGAVANEGVTASGRIRCAGHVAEEGVGVTAGIRRAGAKAEKAVAIRGVGGASLVPVKDVVGSGIGEATLPAREGIVVYVSCIGPAGVEADIGVIVPAGVAVARSHAHAGIT